MSVALVHFSKEYRLGWRSFRPEVPLPFHHRSENGHWVYVVAPGANRPVMLPWSIVAKIVWPPRAEFVQETRSMGGGVVFRKGVVTELVKMGYRYAWVRRIGRKDDIAYRVPKDAVRVLEEVGGC